jgi:hypothetical protein
MTLGRPTLAFISKSWTIRKKRRKTFLISAEMRFIRTVRHTPFSCPKVSGKKLWNNYKFHKYDNVGRREYTKKTWRERADKRSSDGIPRTIRNNQNEKESLGRPLKRWKCSVL